MRLRKYVILIGWIILLAVAGPGYGGEIAVIVNKNNALEEVSSRELAAIFKMEKKFWDDGKPIYLVTQKAASTEKEAILRMVYKMNEQELKQFWTAKIFQGNITSFPKVIATNQSVKAFVRQVPTAISYIDAAVVDDSVKVLRIDGKLPGENGYKLGQ